MGAFARHRFDRGFVLDEERLRRLNSLILSRRQQLDTESKFECKVYRADNFTFTTDSVEDVLQEENSKWQKIIRLTISLVAKDRNIFSLWLDFDDGDTVLEIEGEDRDIVFLTFSDLRQYLEAEVNTLQKLDKEKLTNIMAGTLAVISLAVILSYVVAEFYGLSEADVQKVENVLSSPDVTDKLNFLIEVFLII